MYEPPLYVIEDITEIKNKLSKEQYIKKPVILFFGDSGVGKTTFLLEILKRRNYEVSDAAKEKLSQDDNSEGTKDFVGIEDKYCFWVDARGKRSSESVKDYVTNMSNIRNRPVDIFGLDKNYKMNINRVDFVIILVLAQQRDSNRNIGESSDLYTYRKIMGSFIEEFPVPFSVLFNKADLIEDEKIFEERQQYCTRHYTFPIPNSWRIFYWNNLFRASYRISAKPTNLKLPPTCPKESPSAPRKDKHIYRLSPDYKASYCDTCHTKCTFENCAAWNELNDPDIQAYTTVPPPTLPPDNIDEPLALVITSCKDELAAVAIVKSISPSLEEKFKQSSNIIENIISQARIWEHGPATDKKLCDLLGTLFDLVYTARLSSDYEQQLWKKSSASWFSMIAK